MNPKTREYIYFALGVLGAVWFFVGYPSQDPRSLIDVSQVNVETIEQKATAQLESLGYNSSNFKLTSAFKSNHAFLDTLQSQIGRDKMIARFKEGKADNFPVFYWEINFEPLANKEKKIVIGSSDKPAENFDSGQDISMRFDQSGDFVALTNPEGVIPPKVVHRPALAAAFGAQSDSVRALLSAYSDTVLSEVLLIDLQKSWQRFDQGKRNDISQLKIALQKKRPFRLSRQDVFKMASYYLQETGWNISSLAQDTVYLGRTNGTNTATARFKSTESKFQHELSLNIRLSSTGGLIGISPTHNLEANNGESGSGLWGVVKDAFILLFVIGGIILFFFRIRARAIDTQPALVVSILAGLAISSLAVLFILPHSDFLSSGAGWTDLLELLIGAGLGGAAGSLGFFMFFAVGDSVTRQHWPEKLNMYDYLRQGMIFNKPIGFMLVRSVTLAFMLAGLWTFVLWLFPNLYLEFQSEVFLSQRSAWPPLFMVLSNGIFSLGIVIGIFLVLGGQAFAQTKSKIIASAIMVFACGVVVPYSGNLGPSSYQFIAGVILGLALLYIYLEWDFLTLLLSHFLFLGLLATATGWIIEGSLDTYLFIGNLGLMAVLLLGGFIAIGQGKEEKVLSRYVPQYVEELAQEERIKQELEIARKVQQSFLPVQTPQFEGLELAAICKPAFETGGDYYDFVSLDNNRIAVTIGDVSGKGIQAAFFMTFVKGILHSLCREIDSPSEILKKTNRLFCDNAPRGTFISLVYGIIDLEKKTFHFARAGHNPILRLNSGNGSVKELQPRGIGIGLTKTDSFDQNIEEVELDMTEDDVFVLYTDGIVEALNENKKFYGEHRLNNILLQNKMRSAEDILQEVSYDVRSYIGDAKQHDDMTMVIMKLEKK